MANQTFIDQYNYVYGEQGPTFKSNTSPLPPPGTLSSTITEYAIRTSHHWDHGLIASPVAGPYGTPCEITKLHAVICTKVIEWFAQRIAARCILPDSDTKSFNDVLCDEVISTEVPGRDSDGMQVWSVNGRYVYYLRVPPSRKNDALPAGRQPDDMMVAEGNWILTTDFSAAILGHSPPITVNGVRQIIAPLPFLFDDFPSQSQQNQPAPPK